MSEVKNPEPTAAVLMYRLKWKLQHLRGLYNEVARADETRDFQERLIALWDAVVEVDHVIARLNDDACTAIESAGWTPRKGMYDRSKRP